METLSNEKWEKEAKELARTAWNGKSAAGAGPGARIGALISVAEILYGELSGEEARVRSRLESEGGRRRAPSQEESPMSAGAWRRRGRGSGAGTSGKS